MNRIRVLLADDHVLFRAGIRSLLDNVVDIEVIGEAGTGHEVLKVMETDPPDVVLMDILMPELNGLDAAAQLAAKLPDVRVIILSMNTAEDYVLQALRGGAAGYLMKTINPTELEMAIRTVSQGEIFLSSAISKSTLKSFANQGDERRDSSLARLTMRQREVLQLVAEGYRTKEVARKLGLSVKTIEMHRTHLMEALDIHDIPGLVRYAIRVGLLVTDKQP